MAASHNKASLPREESKDSEPRVSAAAPDDIKMKLPINSYILRCQVLIKIVLQIQFTLYLKCKKLVKITLNIGLYFEYLICE